MNRYETLLDYGWVLWDGQITECGKQFFTKLYNKEN